MLTSLRKVLRSKQLLLYHHHRRSFLTNEYKCSDAWSSQTSSPTLTKVNLNDFYNLLSQNHSSKGVISAVDVDIFANAIKEPIYLEELKNLLHKLRLSAETGNILESTHHATIRNYIEFGNVEELIQILKDPLNFGIFLDYYTANILLDKLLVAKNYQTAADVAGLIMLQEEYDNNITCALCQYASYMYLENYSPPEKTPPVEPTKKVKVEEIKIRIKYLRNPYFDDHFDIQETYTLAGKTLAWLSERSTDNLSYNLQIIGWFAYKKFDKLITLCEELKNSSSFKVFKEVLIMLKKNIDADSNNPEENEKVVKTVSLLQNIPVMEENLENVLKNSIENAINKYQVNDISNQHKIFQSWAEIRDQKLEEQVKRLDRAKRLQLIQENQKKLQEEEQKLWFFDNEEKIDLQIEEKEKLQSNEANKKSLIKKDEDYVPPEIVPQKK